MRYMVYVCLSLLIGLGYSSRKAEICGREEKVQSVIIIAAIWPIGASIALGRFMADGKFSPVPDCAA